MYANANYLIDELGELEIKSYIVYSPKLKKEIIISSDLYHSLDNQAVESYHNKKALQHKIECIVNEFERRVVNG